MILRQTLTKPINGYWDGGEKDCFNWTIINTPQNNSVLVGSWDANTWFRVALGKTEKQTLANARRSLTANAKRRDMVCTFEYIEEN